MRNDVKASKSENQVPVIGDTLASGLPVSEVYSPDDLADRGIDQRDDIGEPGAPPYTRGAWRSYRERPWVMGMYSGAASAENTNLRIRSLLAQGQRGFSVALDLPTQLGLDSDASRAHGEVGVVGTPIDSVEDMLVVLRGIPLDQIQQIRTTANSIGPIMAAMFVAAAREQGFEASQFRVMFQNDVLKEYVARGTQIFPPEKGLRFSTDLVEYCARELPHWEPIEFCGYHIRDSGATAVQEVAIAIANALEYLSAATNRGLTMDDLGHRFVMFLSAGLEVLSEAAKFRAARRIWSRLISERYPVSSDDPLRLNIFCYTLGSPQTAQEPLNNIVRIAYQALAAVLGGAQTLATSAYDEAVQLPSEEAARVALRTQQILAYETDAARTADALGGSYYVESLTEDIEQAVLEYLARIEEQGGGLAALESGWLASELEDSAYDQQMKIESGELPVVGVNSFAEAEPEAALRHRHRIDPAVASEQVERVRKLREERDSELVRSRLAAVRAAAACDENTVGPIIGAVEARATIGEIVEQLKAEWGSSAAH